MPILIRLLTKPLTKRERFEQDTRAFIEKYCADHAAFVSDPAAYYKAQLHEKHPGAPRGFQDDGTQPRYFSPYEDGQRFRHVEAVGGYRCAPYGSDGVAVRAKGFAPHISESGKESVRFMAHGASSKPTLPQAAMPGPIKVGGRWEYPESPNFFAYSAFYGGHVVRAVRFTAVEPSLPALPSPRQPQIATVKTINGRADHQRAYLSNFLYGAPHVLYPSTELKKERAKNRVLVSRNQFGFSFVLRPEDFPDYNPTEAEISQWRLQYWLKRRKFDCRLGRVEPFCACAACQKWYPNLERVDWRTVWSGTDDMTTRKLRDLNARLKLYRYGDHHWQPRLMCEAATKRLQDSRLRVFACGVRPYFWPIPERHPSFRGDSSLFTTAATLAR